LSAPELLNPYSKFEYTFQLFVYMMTGASEKLSCLKSRKTNRTIILPVVLYSREILSPGYGLEDRGSNLCGGRDFSLGLALGPTQLPFQRVSGLLLRG
jgi:hypothetical protein